MISLTTLGTKVKVLELRKFTVQIVVSILYHTKKIHKNLYTKNLEILKKKNTGNSNWPRNLHKKTAQNCVEQMVQM